MAFDKPRRPEDEFDEIVQGALRKTQGFRKGVLPLAVGVLFAVWLASGIFVAQPSENGVIRTFGRHSGTTGSGIGYRLPWPIQQVDIVDVQRIRRTEIGFRSTAPSGSGETSRRVLEEALMLTRDENIVEVGLLIQYQVKDPAAYVFNVQDPDAVLATTAEAALRSAVGRMPIDDVITERRSDVQEMTRTLMTDLLESYGTGILVTDVRLQVADAPDQVRDAFHEVVRAREDRERVINESEAYREDILPRARGEARKQIEAATAFREERVRLARGDSERFLSILQEYSRAPEVTRERMQLEALEKILPRIDKVIISESMSGGMLPFLPLRDAQPATTATTPQGTSAVQPVAPAVPPTGGQ